MNRTDRLYAIVEVLRGRAPDWMWPLRSRSGARCRPARSSGISPRFSRQGIYATPSTDGATPFGASGRSALRKILAVLRDVDADGARALAERIHLFDRRRTELVPLGVVSAP